jgi:uncharacterized protein YjaG (DUF416 family)
MALIKSQEFLNALSKELEPLSFRKRCAFASACCERHYPSYILFSKEFNWGDTALLRRIIDLGWGAALGKAPPSEMLLEEIYQKCLQAIPDADTFSSPTVPYGQDAAIMAAHLVEFLTDKLAIHLMQIAALARDIADAKVQVSEQLSGSDLRLEEKIWTANLMQTEIATLQDFLKLSSALETDEDLKRLKEVAQA